MVATRTLMSMLILFVSLVVVLDARATTITLNGNTVVSDIYDGDTVNNAPVADAGAWTTTTYFSPRTKGVVSNAVSPGAAPGSLQYLALGVSNSQEITVEMTLALGDVIKLDSMVYIPAATHAANFPWEIILSTGSTSPTAANRLLDVYRYATGVNAGKWGSFGASETIFDGPSTYAAEVWQHWTLDYTVGAANATITINGVSVSFAAGNTSLNSPNAALTIITTGTGGRAFYLDDVVPEPASLALLGLSGLAVLRRRTA